MFETVKNVLAKQLHISPDVITPESRIMKDLGADSLHILELIMTLEEDYGVKVPDEKLADFETVGDVVNFIDSLEK